MRIRHLALLVAFALLLVPVAASAAGGAFVDDDDSVHEADIEALATTGITRGCNPPANDRFCPDEAVTRGQMAAFLHRALPDLALGESAGFDDVDDSVFEADIEWLATTGVTRGCNPPANDRFCPDEAVTRGQMAAFLHRALPDLALGAPVSFVDDDDSVFEADIEWLATTGVTRGCNPPANDRFCPDDPVTRGQMASFLVRGLDLAPVEPPPAPACENPPLVPATPVTRNVTVTGSNAYATVEPYFLIDGEDRRLHFVAELVNREAETMQLGEAEIAIYDAAGGRIGTRHASATADSLEPGEVAVISEVMPSLLYFTGETNGYPDGWASWELLLEADPGVPGDYDDRVLGTEGLDLEEDALGSLVGNGQVVNTLTSTVGDQQAWVALSNGNDLVNVAVAYLYEELAPDDRAPFEVTFYHDEPICYTSARSGAAGR